MDDPSRALRYVALGDSYTIGTGLGDPAERWPDRLVASLDGGHGAGPAAAGPAEAGPVGAGPVGAGHRAPGATLELVANLAVNGSTSRDVIDRQLPQLAQLRPGFASLLVGVNDAVRDVPSATYRENAAMILDALLGALPAERIVTVATPDYTVTPEGATYGDPVVRAAAIRGNNAILAELAAGHGIAFVDIHPISLRVADEPRLVAGDGLHPSGAQYALWVARIAPVVRQLLGRRPT